MTNTLPKTSHLAELTFPQFYVAIGLPLANTELQAHHVENSPQLQMQLFLALIQVCGADLERQLRLRVATSHWAKDWYKDGPGKNQYL